MASSRLGILGISAEVSKNELIKLLVDLSDAFMASRSGAPKFGRAVSANGCTRWTWCLAGCRLKINDGMDMKTNPLSSPTTLIPKTKVHHLNFLGRPIRNLKTNDHDSWWFKTLSNKHTMVIPVSRCVHSLNVLKSKFHQYSCLMVPRKLLARLGVGDLTGDHT